MTDPTAAPPDDAGHRGSFTRPDETLQLGPTDAAPSPPLSVDPPARPQRAHRSLASAMMRILLVVFLAAVVITTCGWPKLTCDAQQKASRAPERSVTTTAAVAAASAPLRGWADNGPVDGETPVTDSAARPGQPG
jgi:hypothetical protein